MQTEEAEVSHTGLSLELLTTAHELYKRSNVQTGRLMQHLTAIMAHEHLVAGDAAHAKQLLESVASAPSSSIFSSSSLQINSTLAVATISQFLLLRSQMP